MLGGDRHLELLPDVAGPGREPWPSPLRDGLPALLAEVRRRSALVVLASGDPLRLGHRRPPWSTLLGPDAVDVVAGGVVGRAGAGPARLVGRVHRGRQRRRPRPAPRAARARARAPGGGAVLRREHAGRAGGAAQRRDGYGGQPDDRASATWAAPDESRIEATAATWSGHSSPLNVVAVELVGPAVGSWAAGLPDDAYEHDGQLTKRDLRAAALARLAPADRPAALGRRRRRGLDRHRVDARPPDLRAVAVEPDADRAARIARNADAPRRARAARCVTGRGTGRASTRLPAPDAVFVGGGATTPGPARLRAWQRLRPAAGWSCTA